jgi:hypothetical protein
MDLNRDDFVWVLDYKFERINKITYGDYLDYHYPAFWFTTELEATKEANFLWG